jgi:multiple sugar transport system substrate-binding protein
VAQRSTARNRQLAARFIDFLYGPGMPIWQGKRQNIPPFATIAPTWRPACLRWSTACSAIAADDTPGLYYSYLPVNTIDILHGLLQAVLAGKQSPASAARALQASIAEQARLAGK